MTMFFKGKYSDNTLLGSVSGLLDALDIKTCKGGRIMDFGTKGN